MFAFLLIQVFFVFQVLDQIFDLIHQYFFHNTFEYLAQEEFFFVSGGLMEVQPHQVTIFSVTAIRAEDLEQGRDLESQKRAEQAMQDNKSAIEFAQAKMELAQAAAQIRAIQKLRGKR